MLACRLNTTKRPMKQDRAYIWHYALNHTPFSRMFLMVKAENFLRLTPAILKRIDHFSYCTCTVGKAFWYLHKPSQNMDHNPKSDTNHNQFHIVRHRQRQRLHFNSKYHLLQNCGNISQNSNTPHQLRINSFLERLNLTKAWNCTISISPCHPSFWSLTPFHSRRHLQILPHPKLTDKPCINLTLQLQLNCTPVLYSFLVKWEFFALQKFKLKLAPQTCSAKYLSA